MLIGYSGGIHLCIQYLNITSRTPEDTVAGLQLLSHVAIHDVHRQTIVNCGGLVLGWNAAANARDDRVKSQAAHLVDLLLQTQKGKGLI